MRAASAAATQLFKWSILIQPAVTPTIPSIRPSAISDTTPPDHHHFAHNGGNYNTEKSTVALKRSVYDEVSVVSVWWKADRGGQGAATFGGAAWSIRQE